MLILCARANGQPVSRAKRAALTVVNIKNYVVISTMYEFVVLFGRARQSFQI